MQAEQGPLLWAGFKLLGLMVKILYLTQLLLPEVAEVVVRVQIPQVMADRVEAALIGVEAVNPEEVVTLRQQHHLKAITVAQVLGQTPEAAVAGGPHKLDQTAQAPLAETVAMD